MYDLISTASRRSPVYNAPTSVLTSVYPPIDSHGYPQEGHPAVLDDNDDAPLILTDNQRHGEHNSIIHSTNNELKNRVPVKNLGKDLLYFETEL